MGTLFIFSVQCITKGFSLKILLLAPIFDVFTNVEEDNLYDWKLRGGLEDLQDWSVLNVIV